MRLDECVRRWATGGWNGAPHMVRRLRKVLEQCQQLSFANLKLASNRETVFLTRMDCREAFVALNMIEGHRSGARPAVAGAFRRFHRHSPRQPRRTPAGPRHRAGDFGGHRELGENRGPGRRTQTHRAIRLPHRHPVRRELSAAAQADLRSAAAPLCHGQPDREGQERGGDGRLAHDDALRHRSRAQDRLSTRLHRRHRRQRRGARH